MMERNYVFTRRSLQKYLEQTSNSALLDDVVIPSDGTWEILASTKGGTTFVVHRDDIETTERIIVLRQKEPAVQSRAALQRIHRLAAIFENRSVRFPPNWAEYRSGSLISFFAWGRGEGPEGVRWVADMNVGGSGDVCFYRLTGPGATVDLDTYAAPQHLCQEALNDWPAVIIEVANLFATSLPNPAHTTVDLEATTFGAVTQFRTFSEWLKHLTPNQKAFVERDSEVAVKLRGPAGSGKTLTLAMKALREVYKARAEGKSSRLLFATHSWAVAEQVDAILHTLDESDACASIDVFPLLEIAQQHLPDRMHGRGDYRLLGEDSSSGRRQQLERISLLLRRYVASDWLVYRSGSSDLFRKRVESVPDSTEWNALVWDLMNEFSSVLSAQGILPGVNAERRYLAVQRTPWMMPLDSEADKRFVLRVYSTYVLELAKERILTSDQVVNDFMNYLETFTWNIRRESVGYDQIFVDELHLFSEQERLALHYLTRSADRYPRMFMALDPRQAPFEAYTDFPITGIAGRESGRAEESYGKFESVDLRTVHRYTTAILDLVKHIHNSYPALDLGDDWVVDANAWDSASGLGLRPWLSVHATGDDEIKEVCEMIRRFGSLASTAVIVLDSSQEEKFADALKGVPGIRLSVIRSKDDIDALRYTKKSVVLGPAEYLAGLQFSYVIVCGITNHQTAVANLGYHRRRLLSLLYLAVSRAAAHVEIHTNDENGGVPEVLDTALKAGLITRGRPDNAFQAENQVV